MLELETAVKANSWEMCFKQSPNLTWWGHISVDFSSLKQTCNQRCKHSWLSLLLPWQNDVPILFCLCVFLIVFFVCRLKKNDEIANTCIYFWTWRGHAHCTVPTFPEKEIKLDNKQLICWYITNVQVACSYVDILGYLYIYSIPGDKKSEPSRTKFAVKKYLKVKKNIFSNLYQYIYL
jgi:hypothetical protein